MSDLALAQADGDLDTSGGDMLVVTRADYVLQKIKIRFRFFLGEWFLDRRLGVDYFRSVFVKNPDLDRVRSLFRRVLMSTPGIVAVSRLALTLDAGARALSFAFTAFLTDGEITVDFGDFIIEVP